MGASIRSTKSAGHAPSSSLSNYSSKCVRILGVQNEYQGARKDGRQ